MKEYSATTTIRADRATIWKWLTDADSYPSWDPGTIRIEGKIAPNATLTAHNRINPNRAFPVKVTEFVPNERMTWEGGLPFGLFKGMRTFTLVPQSDGTIQFTLKELYSGLLFPIFGKSVPDMTTSFQNFVTGLKQRSEQA
jgi:hypothetical protein